MVEPLYSNQSLSTDLLRNLRWLPEAKQRPALIENVMLDTEVAAMNCRFVHRCAVVLRQPLIRAPRGCRSWMGTSKGVIVGESGHGGGARADGAKTMKKQGSIIFGTGGDGSARSTGVWFEGAMTAGLQQ
jgi:hypothetical protein